MSAVPNVTFVAFGSSTDRRFAGWAAFRASIGLGRPLDESAFPPAARRPTDAGVALSASVGIWRLIASNNRELARSWTAYPSVDDAREHVTRLQQHADSLVVSIVRGDSASRYGWLASLDGEPVISSGRWFGASSTSLHSAATSIADLVRASIAEAPAVAAAR